MSESPKDRPSPNLEPTKVPGTASSSRDNSAPLPPGEEPSRHRALVQDLAERQRIEEALQQSEEKHRRLIEMTDTGYVIIDDQGRVLDANREYARLTGRQRPEEIIGHSVLEWTAPHDHERNAAEVSKCVAQGCVRNLEIDYVTPAGPVIRVEINATVLLAPGILQILCLCRDITERKRAEAAESEARRLLRDVLNTVPVRVFWKDRESRYLGCNLPFAKDAGFDAPDDLIGKNDFELSWREHAEACVSNNDLELVWRQQADAYRADDRSVMETGVPKIGYEESQTTHRGDRIWLRTSKIPLKDAAGKIIGVLGTYENITEAKRSEEALRESEERLRLAQDAAKAGTWEWDLKTNKNVWSDELWPLYGLEPHRGEASYETWRQSIVSEDRERAEQAAQNAVRSGTELNAEWRVRDRDGKERWLMSRGKPIRDIQGQVVRYLGIVIDITDPKRAEAEREKLQAQLLQAQKMESVGRLAGGVAHDFNNMLQAILGNLSLALEQVPANGQLYEDLLEIQKAAQRSADLTRQLLAFARKQTVSPKILDLNDTVSGTLKMLQRFIGEDVHLAWLPSPELWPVKMDPAQLDQVLANLTVNARDAIAGVGKITIETANIILDNDSVQSNDDCRPGDYVLLVVSDTGCGMAPETKAHLFEPFFTTKGVGEGTGLGLATVYGVVKQNGGHISVFSEPGQGTTFKLYLPRAEAQSVATAVATEKKRLQGAETVLLVEDEAQILNLGRRILQQHGYTILAASLPEQALKLAEQYPGPIHLLVTDVVMPGMNGRELRDRVAALKPGLRCVFMSGYTAEVIAHQGVLEDDIQFLQKPFTVEALARRVREVMDQPLNRPSDP